MGESDGRFDVNYSTEGVAKLREAIDEKLKEFMGDYTDDTLVEYVLVLLKNGRRKDEAKNELDVFLGDDSEAFVSWLWDHLTSNVSLYVEKQDLRSDGEPKIKSMAKQDGENEMNHIKLEASNVTSRKTLGDNYKKQQKAMARDVDENEVPHPQNSVVDSLPADFQRRGDRKKPSGSSRSTSRKKRSRSQDQQLINREVLESSVNGSRRLLQFAVRDAVAASLPSKSASERAVKRLRSLVNPWDSFLEKRSRRNICKSMSAAIQAVGEVAEDVSRVGSSCSVFDRLGYGGSAVSNTIYHQDEYEDMDEDLSDEDFSVQIDMFHAADNPENSGRLPHEGISSFYNTVMPSDLGYDGEGYHDVCLRENETTDLDGFEISDRNLVENSQSYHYGAAGYADERLSMLPKDLHQPAIAPMESLKIASMDRSASHSQYQEKREVHEMKGQRFLQDSGAMANKFEVWTDKESRGSNLALNGNENFVTLSQQAQRSQIATGLSNGAPPTEDADSRTIFVSNVHFAATKDGLLLHFNKFGEVLKVVILTDAATGLPKGSAYIEFMRKETAELALSLDGTSFMSRILKIVRKSCVPPEAASANTWPNNIARSVVSKFGSGPPPLRGNPGVYRGRGVPLGPGARSFQWKRGCKSNGTVASNQASNNTFPFLASNRSMTYLRTETKDVGSSVKA